jgi:hypothetical protein
MSKQSWSKWFYGWLQFNLLVFLWVFGGIVVAKGSTSEYPSPTESRKYPHRLRRAESFLGIHFDFHADANDIKIGENVTRAMVENIINRVMPDFIQCDSKGCPGYSSYPTRVGTPATGFIRDQLRIWREVTAEHGVALYSHYSGLMDSKAAQDHPDWAVVNADGMPDKNFMSVFGPYADCLLIPQLEELRDQYGIDGVG